MKIHITRTRVDAEAIGLGADDNGQAQRGMRRWREGLDLSDIEVWGIKHKSAGGLSMGAGKIVRGGAVPRVLAP